MEEIWKAIPNHNRYEVSNFGRVRFAETRRIKKPKIHFTHHRKEYLVVDIRDMTRPRSNITNRYKVKNFKIGRLVLSAFVGPPPEDKPLCCHNDDDGFNNRLDNLKWGSHAENQAERANPLCENCTKKCRQDSHNPEKGDQCETDNCQCTGFKKKVKSLFVWGKSLEK